MKKTVLYIHTKYCSDRQTDTCTDIHTDRKTETQTDKYNQIKYNLKIYQSNPGQLSVMSYSLNTTGSILCFLKQPRNQGYACKFVVWVKSSGM